MNFNFDYREFQEESIKRLSKIFSESMIDEETEQLDETTNRIIKILDCPEMERCHPYLYTVYRGDVKDEDRQKINALYECGVKRGFIDDDSIKSDDCDGDEGCQMNTDDTDREENQIGSLCGGPDDALTDRPLTTGQQVGVNDGSLFSVLYSAEKDGRTKIGEFFSNASENAIAKDDCVNQLTQAGYNNIKIMAIEQNANGVDTNVTEQPAGVNMYNVMEDDSQEFENQETGSNDSETKDSDSESSTDSSQSSGEEEQPDIQGGTSDTSTEDSGESEDNNDGSEDSTETQDAKSETGSEEQPEENNTEGGTEDDGQDSEEGKDDEQSNDETSEKPEDSSEDEKEDDTESNPEEKKRLSSDEKNTLKTDYTKIFKQVLQKMDLEKSVDEMSLKERTDFYTKISEKWTKNDPSEFLTDKEQEKLNKVVIKKEEEK